MEIKKMVIYSATQKDNYEDTALYKSIQSLNMDVDLCIITNNKTPLAICYNSGLNHLKDEDCIVFIHDDVWLEHDPRPNLERLFDKFDVVGVAGCSQAEINSPCLWHLMGGGFQGGHLHGAVAHGSQNDKQMTSFGKYPHEVVMIDGVFIAFSKKSLESGLRFDRKCPSGFHFYDMCLGFKAKELGLKIGVGDVMITHESSGLKEYTEDWKAGEQYFLENYGK